MVTAEVRLQIHLRPSVPYSAFLLVSNKKSRLSFPNSKIFENKKKVDIKLIAAISMIEKVEAIDSNGLES